MKVGIPKGLMYYKYHPFLHAFFEEMGAELAVSPDTNKEILDLGVKYCVDEACLPIKIFHGHVCSIKDKCDLVVVPRIMQLREREFICPKFCGLPEMISCSIPDMPLIIDAPIYATSKKLLFKWATEVGKQLKVKPVQLSRAFDVALEKQSSYRQLRNQGQYEKKVALIGHPYNVFDNFINMNVTKKLNKLGVGYILEEEVAEDAKAAVVSRLYKKPFWTFARENYGFGVYAAENKRVDGIIYISSFACGIDSVVVELIKNDIGDFPMLILKVDEHTGEAGLDTRIEAFVDMLGGV